MTEHSLAPSFTHEQVGAPPPRAHASAPAPGRPPLAARLAQRVGVPLPGALATDGGTLLLVLAVALALRVAVADRSLWLDETISFFQADRPFGQTLQALVNDFQPPLHHVLLNLWVLVLGPSPLALRSLSIVWSLMAVVAVWAWSREAFPQRSAIPAAALTAFAPFAVWYGTEVRMYAQLLALTALSGWMAWRIVGKGASRRRVTALVAALTGMAYTHYFTSLFMASLGLLAVALVLTNGRLRSRALWVLAALAASVGLLVPWLAWVALRRTAGAFPVDYPDPDFYSALIVGFEMLTGFHSFELLGLLAAGWPALCFLALLLLPRMRRVEWRVGGLFVMLVLPPAALVIVSLIGRGLFDARYLMICAPPLYLLTGSLLGGLRGSRSRLALAVALSAAGIGATMWQNYDPANPKLYELREAIYTVNRLARPGDAILLAPQFTVETLPGDPVLRYYRSRPGLRVVDTATTAGTAVPPAQTWRRLAATRPPRLFLITSYEGELISAPGVVLPTAYTRYFADHARKDETFSFANVSLRVYTPRWREAP